MLNSAGSESSSISPKAIQLLLAENLLVIRFPSLGFCLSVYAIPVGKWMILFKPKKHKKVFFLAGERSPSLGKNKSKRASEGL